MRLSLLSLNLLALGALIAPAYLIFDATSSSLGPWAEACMGAFALGALCILGAMAGLSGRKTNATAAVPLIAVGGILIAVPLMLVLGAVMHR
jgi:hypothetical protein